MTSFMSTLIEPDKNPSKIQLVNRKYTIKLSLGDGGLWIEPSTFRIPSSPNSINDYDTNPIPTVDRVDDRDQVDDCNFDVISIKFW